MTEKKMTEKNLGKENLACESHACSSIPTVTIPLTLTPQAQSLNDGDESVIHSFVPSYAHYDDAGADLCTVEEVVLEPMQRALVPTGVSIALPEGYVAFVHPRSGLAIKKGITVLNAPGTIDSGYRGEIKVPLINLSPETVTFHRGERIAQLVVQQYVKAEFHLQAELESSQRGLGGFGSTGIANSTR